MELSRATMANWVIRCAQSWLKPLYKHMKRQLLEQSVIHADENEQTAESRERDSAVTLFGPGDYCALTPKKGGQEIGLPFFLYGYSTKYYLLDIIGNIIVEVLPGHEYTVCTAGFVFV